MADSLIQIYNIGNFNGQNEELELLQDIAQNTNNPNIKLEFSELIIERTRSEQSLGNASNDSILKGFLFTGYLQKGNAYASLGNNSLALESYLKGLKYALEIDKKVNVAGSFIAIADTYASLENYENSKSYYNKAINILRTIDNPTNLASALLNVGDVFFNEGQLDSASVYTKEAEIIFENINSKIGQAYAMGNMGMIYAEQGKDIEAEQNITEAIEILEQLEDYYPISVYLTYMSDIYLKKNDWNAAVQYAKKSLELARKYGLKDQISDANLKLSELYEHVENYKISNAYYKDHIKYRDSVLNIKNIEAMADLRTDYEVAQKQTEVDLLETKTQLQSLQSKKQRNFLYASGIGLLLSFLLAMAWFRRYRYIKKTNLIIEEERKKSDQLLLNILPEETALELKRNGKVKAKKFSSVSVLFTDFKEFTQFADNLPPEKVVESVGYYFSKFDEIIEKHGLEKIKTIGDAYMCAGGLPYPSEDHALKTVKAALEIVEFVEENKLRNDSDQAHFDVRVGINSGPVVAGVVGNKKFAYDIWGDTVNIAARMESYSEVGKINISQQTYAVIKDDFICEFRGEISVKNKGLMGMYFVKNKV
ncbi:adenylate/guanylate cyclase domain-containing protein [Namhaeicola litoreus]|uniref:Adenylate/guanylate cyclase domain-containing protein n=1 Tax=Namhaeicola litoreus TaxID=1052145 RepID=A0ABW3XYW5_9FLAO